MSTNYDYQKNYRARMREQGYVPVTVWVDDREEAKTEIRDLAETLRTEACAKGLEDDKLNALDDWLNED